MCERTGGPGHDTAGLGQLGHRKTGSRSNCVKSGTRKVEIVLPFCSTPPRATKHSLPPRRNNRIQHKRIIAESLFDIYSFGLFWSYRRIIYIQLSSNGQELRSCHVVRMFHEIFSHRSTVLPGFVQAPLIRLDHLDPPARNTMKVTTTFSVFARRERFHIHRLDSCQIFFCNSGIFVSRYETDCSVSRHCSCSLSSFTSASATHC